MLKEPRGQFYEWRVKWLGEPDHVAAQLRDIARQGSSMARLAHACAFLLIVLFSAGSLVALGGDALASIVTEWNAGGVNIPAAISVGVSTLMVLAMDVGMVYAASMLRLLTSRRADAQEMRVHKAVIAVVAILEAATYGYMSYRYESPATWAAWALILSRALAAPLLSVYLSMARPLPVTARDILYQAELAAGKGVIRDVVTVASDQGAPLHEKMTLYGAAATMTPHDRTRLDSMIEAVQSRASTLIGARGRPSPPTNGGTPLAALERAQADAQDTPEPRQLRAVSRPRQAAANGRSSRGRSNPSTRTTSAEAIVRRVWRQDMTVGQLQSAAKIGRSTASKWYRLMRAEDEQAEQQAQVAQ